MLPPQVRADDRVEWHVVMALLSRTISGSKAFKEVSPAVFVEEGRVESRVLTDVEERRKGRGRTKAWRQEGASHVRVPDASLHDVPALPSTKEWSPTYSYSFWEGCVPVVGRGPLSLCLQKEEKPGAGLGVEGCAPTQSMDRLVCAALKRDVSLAPSSAYVLLLSPLYQVAHHHI